MPRSLIAEGELVLEGTLVPDEYIEWFPDGAFTASMVRDALAEMSGDITVRVNSPGGYPMGGESIRVMLAEYDGAVTVKIVGEACSAASLMIMSADRIEMSLGSVMMVHDPSTITFGTSDDHERAASALNEMADAYAAVYAAKSGRSPQAMRQIMKDELWMGPSRAMAEGFADGLIDADATVPADPEPAIMRARDHYATAMSQLATKISKIHPASQATPTPAAHGSVQLASPATMEAPMPTRTQAAPAGGENAATPAVTPTMATPATSTPTTEPHMTAQMERTRITAIMSAARPHMASGVIDQAYVDGLIEEGVSVEMASHRILSQLSGAQDDVQMTAPAQPRRNGLDDTETRREGIAQAFMARLTGEAPADDRARPYMGMSVHEMAAAASGQTPPRMGSYRERETVVMNAMHTTSDFPNILSTSINRVIAQQYELVERTFAQVSREMEFNDFRPHDVVRPDEFPTLKPVNEAGEIKFGTLGDSKETVALGAYATGLAISRQAMVNDDLGAIQSVIDNAVMIVPEFEEATFWAYFLSNAALADGTAMFHADHGNLAGSGTAITVAAISAGRTALRTMKAADGVRNVIMNAPANLLVGPAKETEAEQFVAASIVPTKASDTNPFAGKLRVVVTETITDNAWYLMVDPAKRTHNFKHGYLRGGRAPRVRVEEPFGRQGMAMTLEQDFGVGGVNHRGAYKNPGA